MSISPRTKPKDIQLPTRDLHLNEGENSAPLSPHKSQKSEQSMQSVSREKIMFAQHPIDINFQ